MIVCTYIDVVISFLRLQVRVSEPKHNRSDTQLNLIEDFSSHYCRPRRLDPPRRQPTDALFLASPRFKCWGADE